MRFEFEATGDQLIARELDRFAGRSVAAKPAFEKIADNLRGYERRLFDSQGSSGGTQWKGLADSTIAAKAAAKLDPRVLHATLALRKSLTHKRDPNHEEIVADDFLLFGSKLDYAGRHQHGGINPRTGRRDHPPKRKPLQYTEQQKRRIIKTLQRYIVTGEV